MLCSFRIALSPLSTWVITYMADDNFLRLISVALNMQPDFLADLVLAYSHLDVFERLDLLSIYGK